MKSNQRGGARPGAGRKRGSQNRRTKEQREAMIETAKQTGLLPHQILLAVSQGRSDAIFGKKISAEEKMLRIEAARAAAPYYAPRLAAIVAKITDMSNPWEEILQLIDGKSRGLPARARLRLINGRATEVKPAI